MCSNFYDIWGDFLEATQNEQVFPTLTALKRLGASPDDREVVYMKQIAVKQMPATYRTQLVTAMFFPFSGHHGPSG